MKDRYFFNLLRYILTIVALFSAAISSGQELNCRFQLNSTQIPSSDRTQFEQMQKAILEFYNNTIFTNHKIKTNERIEFNLSITLIKEVGSNEYEGELQFAYTRPIYGTSYNSPVLNINDQKIQFRYTIGDPIQFNINSSTGSLASLLTYYAYLALAIDYETFSPKGGQAFLEIAERVVNNAQNDASPGWRSFENNGRNRAAVIEELLNTMYEPLRMALYKYHRLGLDVLAQQPEQGRKEILEAIELLRPIYQRRSDSYLIQLFVSAKADEIVSIFSEATPDEKRRAVNIMTTIDPANAEKYRRIMAQQRP
ncbi:MAG TPA: DUF4835 family protein [Salinivirgaceae bacterium]|nr:DUF4835 family protein [Salinivirgaceae bacterium]